VPEARSINLDAISQLEGQGLKLRPSDIKFFQNPRPLMEHYCKILNPKLNAVPNSLYVISEN
jgi:hypothetical protein